MCSIEGHPSAYPIVEYSVLGHAVGSAELLHPASIMAVQHFVTYTAAVGAGSPRVVLAARLVVCFEGELTAWNTDEKEYYFTCIK